jgi:hypothetical protein
MENSQCKKPALKLINTLNTGNNLLAKAGNCEK